jgi:hypothetical protein
MKFLSDVLAKAGLIVDGVVTLNNTATGQTPDANDNSTKLATTAWVRTFVQPYSLPIASASVLGGIKVGTGLSINSTTGVLSVSGAGAASIKSTQTFVVTEGQTVFTVTGGYTPGLIDIFVNGVYLSPNQTTATNGTTFTINDPAATGDIVDVIVVSAIYQGATTTTDQLPEGIVNLYYTDARARAAISLTTNGSSGVATYVAGVLNIPNYRGLVPAGGVAGQVLSKVDGNDYNTQWLDEAPASSYTSQLKHRVKSSQAINKGQAVYVSSADGTNMIVSKASNASEATSSKTMGLLESTVSINGTANVITEGLLAGLDTTGANAAGDPVWLGTDGNLIYGLVSKPSAPAHLVFIGVVTRRNANNGEIFVKVQNGFELDELHDLSVKNASDGDMIKYVASTGLWTKIAATTTNITEGTNLYYTQARFDTAFAAKSTSNLTEGTNLYYTTARANSDFDTRLATKSTTNLTEGTNLYYTTARANSDFDTRLATKSTTNLAEGTNLYYTDARVGTYLTANSYATQSYVSTQINNLVSGAPGLLDTLDELAAALGDDPNFATTVTTALGNRLRIDTASQGLTGTQQGYGRTNLGLGSLSTLSSIGDAYITDLAYSKLTGVPSTFAPSAHTHDDRYYTETEIGNFFSGASAITGYNKTNWDTAYGWGNHASGGYLTTASAASTYVSLSGSYANPSWITALAWSKITGAPAFITGYTETDTLQSVILRNGTTNTGFTITNTNDTYSTAASTNVPVIYLYNTGTTATANAIIALRTNTATGGDPILSFDIGGVIGWSMGIDNSDSDKFKIARSWAALDSETRFSMALDGTANFTGSLTAANLSGTNTGDQTNISGLAGSETLATVTGRGATTSSNLTFSGQLTLNKNGTQIKISRADTAAADWFFHSWASGINIYPNAAGTVYFGRDGSATNVDVFNGTLYQQGNAVWHAGNLTNLNQLSNGPGYITSSATSLTLTGNLTVSSGNATGGGIILADDGDIVDLNDAYCSMRFSYGVRIFSANRGGSPVITLGSNGVVTATTFNGALNGNASTASYSSLDFRHSDRDFPAGTLVQTSINYAVSSGDAFVLEIRGNSYFNTIPFDVQIQGYIYGDTIISTGGYSNGKYIDGIRAINYNGNLCFWWPSGGYWEGFNVKVYAAFASFPSNRVTSISNSGLPTTAKQVFFSPVQSLHSSNFNSYAPSLTGGGASGSWNINAASVNSRTVGNGKGNIGYFDTVGNLYINNPESYSGEVRLGAAWSRGGIYTSNTLSLSTGSSTIDMVYSDATRFRYLYDSNGARLMVNTASTPYTLIDTNARPVIYARGAYPVLTLDHTETSNGSHGPTIQFVFNGSNNRQWVYGASGDGAILDWGYSDGGSNTNFNPHHGIGGYQGVTYMTVRNNGRMGFGWEADWGTYGANAGPLYPFHFIGSHQNTHTYVFRNTTNASNGVGAIFVNTLGNHSWGIVTEFRIDGSGDRPSILFSNGQNSNTWSVGHGGYDDNFRINRDHGHRNGGWGTTLMVMDRSGNVTFSGDVTAFSDIRLKDNITKIDNALEKLSKINGVIFTRKDEIEDNIGRKHTGVIAQEVLEVLPEVVSKSSSGHYQVAYGNMAGLFIEAIKEQQLQIESQKSEIEELKDLVKQLINR